MKLEPESHPLAAEAAGLVHPRPVPPEGGTAIEVAPGIQWIRMPLPFALDHINLWLLEDEGGVTAVDTGVGLPPTRDLWEKLFAGALAGRPVVRVLVTHFHPDHMGNADWLARRFGVELWCPQAEWLMAQLGWRGMGGNDSEPRVSHYRRHGVAEAQVETFRDRGNHYFRRQLDTHQLGFAIGETLAHLHDLETEGQAARLVDAAGIHRFRKA